jgi:hypothetical protein
MNPAGSGFRILVHPALAPHPRQPAPVETSAHPKDFASAVPSHVSLSRSGGRIHQDGLPVVAILFAGTSAKARQDLTVLTADPAQPVVHRENRNDCIFCLNRDFRFSRPINVARHLRSLPVPRTTFDRVLPKESFSCQ